MERNKNTGTIIIVVILSIIVWVIAGYFVYDQFLSNDSPPINNNGLENGNQNNEDIFTGAFSWNDTIEFESFWTGGFEGLGEYIEAWNEEVSIELFLNADASSVLVANGVEESFGHRGTFVREDNFITYTITDWGQFDFNNVWIPQETNHQVTSMTFMILDDNNLNITNDELLINIGLINNNINVITLTRR